MYYGVTAGVADGIPYSKPDYVFEKNYEAFSTSEVAAFLEKENHLPWITSAAKEKEENGDVTDMTRMAFETVETVENLQLQIIELSRKLEVLNEIVLKQQKEIETFKSKERF